MKRFEDNLTHSDPRSFSFSLAHYFFSLCANSEEVGDETLLQLGRQREQLEVASSHLEATRNVAIQASFVLRSM